MTYKIIHISNHARDITGYTFGRLTAIAPVGKTKNSTIKWLCICECSTESVVPISALSNGTTKSCGCLAAELSSIRESTHGATGTPEHEAWLSISKRLVNPNHKSYPRYGGRGIMICDRWKHSFENFLSDVGHRPSTKHSIDRIDNDGNYEPGNCKWSIPTEQMNNRENCRHITYRDVTLTVSQWARIYGMSDGTLHRRIFSYHWPLEKALNQPVR